MAYGERWGELDTHCEQEYADRCLQIGDVENLWITVYLLTNALGISRKWSRLNREVAKKWRAQSRGWRDIGQYGMSQVIWTDQEVRILEDENRRLREENAVLEARMEKV